MKDKILITGGSGLLAINWALKVRDDYSVILGMHDRIIDIHGCESIKFSLSSVNEIIDVLNKENYKIVIHTVGFTSVEGCEENPDLARHINVFLSKNIAEACYKVGVQLIYISTDHLFQGITPFMKETDAVSPLNTYGLTKAEAEVRVVENNPNALIIRTNFYGWGSSYRKSFSDMVIDDLRDNKKINLFCDVYYTPILISTLISAVHKLLEVKVNGIVNVVGNERLSKYEFGLKLAECFSLDPNLLQCGYLNNKLVKRPFDMSLSNKKLCEYLGNEVNSIEQDLCDLKNMEKSSGIQEIKKI